MPVISLLRQTFEAQFLGGPVFRLVLAPDRTPETLMCALNGATAELRHLSARLAVCRIPEADDATTSVLVHCGFRQVETLVTYVHGLAEGIAPPTPNRLVESAVAEDRDPCAAIAADAFVNDRFHADPAIDRVSADALKRAWILNSFAGRAHRVFVARVDGGVGGFVACNAILPEKASIDLIAVARRHRGLGLGRALVARVLTAYRGEAGMVTVGTQAGNVPSERLYRGMDFEAGEHLRTFHWHPPCEAQDADVRNG